MTNMCHAQWWTDNWMCCHTTQPIYQMATETVRGSLFVYWYQTTDGQIVDRRRSWFLSDHRLPATYLLSLCHRWRTPLTAINQNTWVKHFGFTQKFFVGLWMGKIRNSEASSVYCVLFRRKVGTSGSSLPLDGWTVHFWNQKHILPDSSKWSGLSVQHDRNSSLVRIQKMVLDG